MARRLTGETTEATQADRGGGAGVTASSIRSELSVIMTTIVPPENSGYLFKWQDRSIR